MNLVKKMNLVFLMRTEFPYGKAYSSRARNLTKLFCKIGYHVHVIAPKSQTQENSTELDAFDFSCDYINSKESVIKLIGIGTAKPYMRALRKYSKSHKIDVVLSSNIVHVTDHIRRFCKGKGIPYIIEQCEWFDKSSFVFGELNPYYREHINCTMKKNRRCNGIIAISRLLEEHYTSQNVRTIRIPTILDSEQVKYRRQKKADELSIKIVFAGSLGNGKEILKPILQALQSSRLKKTILFEIISRVPFETFKYSMIPFNGFNSSNEISLIIVIQEEKKKKMFLVSLVLIKY